MAYCVQAEGSHTLHVNCLDGPGYRLDKLFDFFETFFHILMQFSMGGLDEC